MKTKEEIEQLAESQYGTEIGSIRGSNPYDLEGDRKNGFIKGYTQCQEDMADKKYTEEDLREAISLARKTKVNVFGANGEESIGFVHSNNEVLKIVVNKQD